MKKLITLLLALAGMVSTASATSTTLRIYAENQVGWGNVNIFANYWNPSSGESGANIEILPSTPMTQANGNWYYADVTLDNDLVNDAMSNYGIKFQFNNGTNWTSENQIKDVDFLSENHVFYIYNNNGYQNSHATFTYYFAKSLANSAVGDAVALTPSNNVMTTTVDNESSITEAWYVLYPSFAESGGYITNWNLTLRPVTNSGNYDITSFINYNGTLMHGSANGVFYVNNIYAKNDFSFDLTNMSFSVSPYFSRTISNGCATFSSDYNVTIPDGVTAYYATACAPGTVTMTAISDGIPSTEGVYLVASNGSYKFEPAVSVESTVTPNKMVKGTDDGVAASTGSAYNYVLASQGGTVGFFEVNSAVTADMTGKAYLQNNSSIKPAGARVAIIFNDETGILGVEESKNIDNRYYNLSGQCVAQPTKGMYIVNGKKIMVNK